MAERSTGLFLAVSAFILYIAGGVAAFGGIALIAFMGGHDLFGWGAARTVGYLSICVGAFLSIMGVLILRLVRNRTDCLVRRSAIRHQNPGTHDPERRHPSHGPVQ